MAASQDSDLNELLDSALEDFDNLSKKKKKTVNKDGFPNKTTKNDLPSEEDLLSMFAAAGLATSNENIEDGKKIDEELKKLSQLSVEESDALIKEKLSQTLSQLQQSSQAATSQEPIEEDLSKMFSKLGSMPDEGGGNFDNLLPMMEGMMQSLLSKELLYPAMKDIADKFPDWLADNRNKVTDEEFVKYNKQFALSKKICFLYEEEKDEESSDIKKKRFEKVMELMQEMQSFGHPPKELVGESNPGIQLDAYGNPMFPHGMEPSQCSVQWLIFIFQLLIM